jgi:hypothetical protein
MGQDGDGFFPLAGPLLDDVGNLYGTTDSGGTSHFDGSGTVFPIKIRQE